MFNENRSNATRFVSGAVALLIVVLVSGISQADDSEITSSITTRVSISSNGSQGNGASQFPKISANGRYIAFHSSATNLIEGETGTNDVFVYDRETGETSLVSITSDGLKINSHSNFPSISADGQFIAFESFAKDLVDNDSDFFQDIFIHDRDTGETTLVSITSAGVSGNGHSQFSSISADGRYVAFMSTAKNFVGNHSNNYLDIFVHDRETAETTIVSRASDGTIANGESRWSSISSDGRYVLFQSEATNLVENDSNGYIDVFMHDRETGETTLVSVASDGTQGNLESGLAEISADGRFIVFESDASNLIENDENNHGKDIFIRNLDTGEVTLVSVASDSTQGNQDSRFPSISADGQFITFESFADNLVENDENGTVPDIFLHDRETGETTLISVASDGTQGNNVRRDVVNGYPSISADGRFVTFGSLSSNLVENDTNDTSDIFVHDRGESVSQRTISGKVQYQDGTPLANAQVTLSNTQSVMSDSSGNFVLSGVAQGQYDLFVSKLKTEFLPSIHKGIVVDDDVVGIVFRVRNELDTEPFLHLPVRLRDGLKKQDVFHDSDNDAGLVSGWFDHNRTYKAFTNVYGDKFSASDALDGDPHPQRARWYFKNPAVTPNNPERKIRWWYDGHLALDFANDLMTLPNDKKVGILADTSVYPAADDGCIVARTDSGDYGNSIYLYHPNGYFTHYSHMQGTEEFSNHKVGDCVSRDDMLGIIGKTGTATGFHLDFELIKDVNSNGQYDAGVDKHVDSMRWEGTVGADPWGPDSQEMWVEQQTLSAGFGSSAVVITDPSGRFHLGIPAQGDSNQQVLEFGIRTPHGTWLTNSLRTVIPFFIELLTNSQQVSASGVESASFTTPITITASYSGTLLSHLDPNKMQLSYWNETNQEWQKIDAIHNTEKQELIAQTSETGQFAIQAPLLCLDASEPWNDNSDNGLELEATQPLTGTFDIPYDQDWFTLQAEEGKEYVISTTNFTGGADTMLELYADPTSNPVATDMDLGEGKESNVTWTASSDGQMYVRVTPEDRSSTGCNAKYSISMSEKNVMNFIFLPLIER